jgi:hypothetical protein
MGTQLRRKAERQVTGKRFRLGVHDLEGGPIHYVGRLYDSSTDDEAIMRDIIREYNIAVEGDPDCTMVMSKFDVCSGLESGRADGD